MSRTTSKEITEVTCRLTKLGFGYEEIAALRRIAGTLHRWAELECGDSNDVVSWSIERDEETKKPYRVIYPHSGSMYRIPIADREAGALKRLAGIMAAHPELTSYHQTDPRGASLYILRPEDVRGSVHSCYTNGIAVY